ncbi:MAG: RNA polymerase Rpb4 family protein [Thermoplasmata archaeon]|nr:MAG: RNA polymerase Rpb4 family protein [Thermoplasmata archaeon]KAA0009144.1 MAG: RNA polymerase Rpb4 family protein [Thermoplasmata archaeon]MCD6573313.1 RNA polymerase Rpb4 family protein [Thermoplasmata archaeon]RLB60979.1 MAG: RNA polymerase Rpb4 family protein [Deltaproteobacteria bacterium]
MKIVLISEVKEILSKLSKERDLKREQKIALEHSEKVNPIPAKKARELVSKLMEIGRIEEKQACKIADLLPKDEDELLAIFAKETYIPSKEEIEEILNLVREYS